MKFQDRPLNPIEYQHQNFAKEAINVHWSGSENLELSLTRKYEALLQK